MRDLTKLTSHSHAYAYWKTHAEQFKRNFYFRGYSGWALRLAHVAFFVAGVSKDVKKLCQASSTAEQERIWTKKPRPIMLNRMMIKFFLGNPWVFASAPYSRMTAISIGMHWVFRGTR